MFISHCLQENENDFFFLIVKKLKHCLFGDGIEISNTEPYSYHQTLKRSPWRKLNVNTRVTMKFHAFINEPCPMPPLLSGEGVANLEVFCFVMTTSISSSSVPHLSFIDGLYFMINWIPVCRTEIHWHFLLISNNKNYQYYS